MKELESQNIKYESCIRMKGLESQNVKYEDCMYKNEGTRVPEYKVWRLYKNERTRESQNMN